MNFNRPISGAIEDTFSDDVNYAKLQKIYTKPHAEVESHRRCIPTPCLDAKTEALIGAPNMKEISTSYIKCQNLAMCMGPRRFTRFTNAFSKKLENDCNTLAIYVMQFAHTQTPASICAWDCRISRSLPAFSKTIENHCHALAIYSVHYNFAHIRLSTRATPAIAAGKLWDVSYIVRGLEAYERDEPPQTPTKPLLISGNSAHGSNPPRTWRLQRIGSRHFIAEFSYTCSQAPSNPRIPICT